MNISVKVLLVSALLTASYQASADYKNTNSFYTKAKVVKVIPIYQQVKVATSRVKCKRVYHEYQQDNALPTVVGAVVGGVVGNQIFKKSKLRGVGTVTGAVIGGAIANDATSSRQGYRSERYCKPRYKVVDELVGYKVRYRYQGELFTTRTEQRPGRYIKLKVKLKAV